MSVILERLPELQEQRQHEYIDQANSAQILLRKLIDTRVEAERISRGEFDNTNTLKNQLINQHPLVVEWRENQKMIHKQREDAEKNRNLYLMELNRLRIQEGELQRELERWKKHELEKEQRFGSIGTQIYQLSNDLKRLQEEHDKTSEKERTLQGELEQLLNYLQKLEIEMQGNRNSRESKEREISLLNQEIQSLRIDLEAMGKRREELLSLSQELEKKCNQAKHEESEAVSLEARTKDLYQSRYNELERLQREFKEKSENLEHCEHGKSEFAKLLQKTLSEIEQIDSRISNLKLDLSEFNEKKRIIREQIERLLREEYQVDHEIMRYNKEIDDQESTKAVLKADKIRIQNNIERDQNMASSFKESLNQLSFLMDQEKHFSNQLKEKCKEANDEKNKAQELYQRYSKELENIKKDITLPSVDKGKINVNDLSNKQSLFQNECNFLDNDYQKLSNELGAVNFKFKELEKMLAECKKSQADISNQISINKDQINDLNSKKSTMNSSAAIINNLQGKLEKINKDIENIKNNFGNFPENIPDSSSGRQQPSPSPPLLSSEEESNAIERRVRSMIDSSPPSVLQQQLCKEAEALMRYEAALAMEKRQNQVLRDAEELAKIKIKKGISFTIDSEGQRELLSRHESVGKEPVMIIPEMGEKVVEMCQKHHITAI